MSQPQCPKCKETFVRRTLRKGMGDHLLSWAYIYPFRCQLCAHRFRLLEVGKQYNEATVDKRQYERVTVNIPATFVGDRMSGAGTITHLSLGGCALETPVDLIEGMLINVRLQPPHVNPPINVETAIVRSIRRTAAGVEFLRTNQSEQYRLVQYVAKLLIAQYEQKK